MSENKGMRHGQAALSPRPSVLKESNRANLPVSPALALKGKQPIQMEAKGDAPAGRAGSQSKENQVVHAKMARDIVDQVVVNLPLSSAAESDRKAAEVAGEVRALRVEENPFQTRLKIPNSPPSRSLSDSSESDALSEGTKESDHLPRRASQPESQGKPGLDTSGMEGLDDMLSALAGLSIGEKGQAAPAGASLPTPLPQLATADAPADAPAPDTSLDKPGRVESEPTHLPLNEEQPSQEADATKDSVAASEVDVQDVVDPFKPRSQIPNSPHLDNQDDDSEISLNMPAMVDAAGLDGEVLISAVSNDTVSSSQSPPVAESESNANDEVKTGMEESAVESQDDAAEVKDASESLLSSHESSKPQASPENLEETKPSSDQHIPPQVSKDGEPHSAPGALPEPEPFKTMTWLANSPAVEQDPFKPKTQLANSPVAEQNLFKPESQLANSPAVTSTDEEDPFKSKTQLANSPVAEDPSKAKKQIASSPVEAPEADPSKPKAELANSPMAEEDPFKSKTQLANSPLVEQDPFKSKKQLANSPAAPEVDPFKPKTQLANSPVTEKDPVRTEGQLAKSPTATAYAIDPFKPKTQLANSPAVDATVAAAAAEAETLRPKTELANSPVTEEQDPFKTKNQLANSPAATPAAEVDPFKPKTQLANSPMAEENPFNPKIQLTNSPLMEEEASKAKEQLVNSPVVEKDPLKPKTQLANSPVAEEDPFKAKKQLANSPAASTEEDPFKPRAQLANSPAADAEVDPFKPKAQLANSPVAEEDPFRAKKQLAISPAAATEEDSFKPKAQLANSPVAEEDPFKAKKQLASSPAAATEEDPFKPKAQLANSPVAEEDPFKAKKQLASSPAAATEEDPFKARAQLANSPLLEEKHADVKDPLAELAAPQPPGTPRAQEGSGEGKGESDLMVPFTPMPSSTAAPESAAQMKTEMDRLLGTPMVGGDPAFSQQGLLFTDEQLSLGDDAFNPAAEVFKDPSTWDLLEKFGTSQQKKETDLARMSLYRKFDPLVRLSMPPGSPKTGPTRATKGKPADQAKDQSIILEESIVLMGTPPRKAKRRSLMSHRHGNQNVSMVQQQVIEEEQAVDQFFTCSPAGNLPTSQIVGVPTAANTAELVRVLAYTEAEVEERERELLLAHQGELIKREEAWSREREALKKSCTKARDALAKAKEDQTKMAEMITEYEKVIQTLMEEKEKASELSKEQVEQLKKEKESALEDVQSLERAFSDLLKRYEKLRTVADGFKQNEEVLKKALAADREKLKTAEENYRKVKQAAEEKLSKLSEEQKKVQAALTAETARLEAAQRRIQNQEKALQQKDSEIHELTQICDSLISRTGS